MADYTKPVPNPADPDLTEPFWQATKEHHMVIPRCPRCERYFWFPRQICPRCLQDGWEWTPVSGKGRLYSWTVVRQPQNPIFNDDVPYAFAMVRLDEGVDLVANMVGIGIDELRVDMPVEATYDDVTPDWTLFRFKPAS